MFFSCNFKNRLIAIRFWRIFRVIENRVKNSVVLGSFIDRKMSGRKERFVDGKSFDTCVLQRPCLGVKTNVMLLDVLRFGDVVMGCIPDENSFGKTSGKSETIALQIMKWDLKRKKNSNVFNTTLPRCARLGYEKSYFLTGESQNVRTQRRIALERVSVLNGWSFCLEFTDSARPRSRYWRAPFTRHFKPRNRLRRPPRNRPAGRAVGGPGFSCTAYGVRACWI